MLESARKTLLHAFVLIIAVGFAFFFSQSVIFSKYLLQFISFLVLLYLFLQFISKKISFLHPYKLSLDFLLITLVVYLLVFQTGALFSPIFFLIYFLLFGISLLFEPSSAFSLSLISAVFFLLTPSKDFWPEILQLFSLFLISPLALIFGNQYLNLQKSENKVEKLEKEETILVKEVISQEKEVKRWTSDEFTRQLIKIWENLDQIAKDKNLIKKHTQKLTEISNQLSKLLKSAKEMEKKIEA